MSSRKDNKYHLQKILFYCESIISFTKNRTIVDFRQNNEFNFALVFALSQIGEQANKLSNEFKILHSHIPWRHIIALRHRIVHDYSGLQDDAIWETVTESIPELLEELQNLINN